MINRNRVGVEIGSGSFSFVFRRERGEKIVVFNDNVGRGVGVLDRGVDILVGCAQRIAAEPLCLEAF